MDLPIGPILEHYGADVPDLTPGCRWKPLRCVFHDDQNASASVNYTGYRCHSCPAHGNAVTLIAWKENIDYASAERRAQEILGPSYREVREGAKRRGHRVFGERAWNDRRNESTISNRISGKPASRTRARKRMFGHTVHDSCRYGLVNALPTPERRTPKVHEYGG